MTDTQTEDSSFWDKAQSQTIPWYQKLGELGRGNFALVLKARDLRSKQEVAIKIFRRRWDDMKLCEGFRALR